MDHAYVNLLILDEEDKDKLYSNNYKVGDKQKENLMEGFRSLASAATASSSPSSSPSRHSRERHHLLDHELRIRGTGHHQEKTWIIIY